MNNNYKSYRKYVDKLLNGTKQEFQSCIERGLVVQRKVNMNGEPYRYLTRLEWENKFNSKKT